MAFRIGAFFVAGFILFTLGMSDPLHAGAPVPRTNPSAFTPQQWNDVYATIAKQPLPQRVAFWADRVAINAQYVLDPLGEGAGQQPDPDPLVDFKHVDCLTYVEEVYALALAPNHARFGETLQRIRYKDGQIAYRWRNHYTVSDWLPANAWFLHDVTEEVGAGQTCTMTKTISRAAFFAKKGLTQFHDIPDEVCTTRYIPRNGVKHVAGKLHTGDMIIFIISTPGIIAGHVGIIRIEHGIAYAQHASLSAKKVVTIPLAEYLQRAPARFVGFKIARLNEHIIVPEVR